MRGPATAIVEFYRLAKVTKYKGLVSLQAPSEELYKDFYKLEQEELSIIRGLYYLCIEAKLKIIFRRDSISERQLNQRLIPIVEYLHEMYK